MSSGRARSLVALAPPVWVTVIALAFHTRCTVPPIDYTGKQCPCLEPWVCGDGGVCLIPPGDASPDSDIEPDGDMEALRVSQLASGLGHTCALLSSQALRCWGRGELGALGYASTEDVGDDETPASLGDVDVGGPIVEVMARNHTCAALASGSVRCWGQGSRGQLGHGNVESIGDDETPASAGDAAVGGDVLHVAVGSNHSCAVDIGGVVRCWGEGSSGQLGYGNTDDIGDDELPESADDVDVGGAVTQIVAGELHTCALLDTGAVRCWGSGDDGRLGYRNTRSIGDDETPASAGDIDLGGSVTEIAAGWAHTCALLDTGAVRCWGVGLDGRLGYGNERNVGDHETPASVGNVDIGGVVVHIAAGMNHTCALLDSGSIRCWGGAAHGQLGYGNTIPIGDTESPAETGYVNVGGHVTQVTAGANFTCALLDTGAVRCWGDGTAIGLGSPEDIGDDEPPSSVEPVPLI